MKLTKVQRNTLQRIIQRFDSESEFNLERWGCAIERVDITQGIEFRDHRTVLKLERLGLITLHRHLQTHETLDRGSYGRWLGGTTRRHYTAFTAAPTSAGRAALTGL